MFLSTPPFPLRLLGRVYVTPPIEPDTALKPGDNVRGLHDLFGCASASGPRIVIFAPDEHGVFARSIDMQTLGERPVRPSRYAAIAAVSMLEDLRLRELSRSLPHGYSIKPGPTHREAPVAAVLVSHDGGEAILMRYGLRHDSAQYALRFAPMEGSATIAERANWDDGDASLVAMYRTVNSFVGDQTVADEMCARIEGWDRTVSATCYLRNSNGLPTERLVRPFRIRAANEAMWQRWTDKLCPEHADQRETTFVRLTKQELATHLKRDRAETRRRLEYIVEKGALAIEREAASSHIPYVEDVRGQRPGNGHLFPLVDRLTSMVAGGYGDVITGVLDMASKR